MEDTVPGAVMITALAKASTTTEVGVDPPDGVDAYVAARSRASLAGPRHGRYGSGSIIAVARRGVSAA